MKFSPLANILSLALISMGVRVTLAHVVNTIDLAGLPVNNTGTHQGNEVSNAQTNDGTITTVGTLDIRTFLPFSARVAYIGCIVIRRKDGNGGPPFPAVVNPTRNRGNCARFNITSDQKSHIFRFQEVKSGKFMHHEPGSHWIYLQDDPTGSSEKANFKLFKGLYQGLDAYDMEPVNILNTRESDTVFAVGGSGDLNVKALGYRIYIDKKSLVNHHLD